MSRRLNLVLGVLIALILIGGSAFLLYHHLENKAANGRLRLDDAEINYDTLLRDRLKTNSDPESQSSASVFFSASAINSVLSGANTLKLELPSSNGTYVLIRSVQTNFRDGFPEIVAKLTISRDHPAMTLDANLTGVLEPRLDKSDASVLLFYIHPLSIEVGLPKQVISKDATQVASDLLSKLALVYTDHLPHFQVPLSKDFDVAFPVSKAATPVLTQAGKLNGELDIPGLSFHTALSLSGLVFLSDGIHMYLSAKTGPSADKEASSLLPFMKRLSARGFSSEEETKSLIKTEDANIAAIQSELEKLTSSIKVNNADFRIWVSKDLLMQVAEVFNSLTPDQRRIHFHTLSEEGQLYRAGGGGLGCGGYAELVGGNSANANLQVANLVPSWKVGEGFTESADFQFAFDAQVTGHVNGPAGPHPTWVLNCVHLPLVNKDVCTNLPSVTVSCETPVGGGIGLGSYGIHGDRTERLTAAVSLHSDSSSWLDYDLKVLSPNQVPITIQIGMGQLGTLGLPFAFDVPHQALMSGKAPLLFSQSGIIESPNGSFSKKYSISATPSSGTVGTNGYAAVGTIRIQWQ